MERETRRRVGIIGAGQLARMTLQAAIALDVPVRLLAAAPDNGAALVWPDVAIGAPNDFEAVSALAAGCSVVTFDHELVDVSQLRRLEAEGRCLRPSASTMAIAQDKGRQRTSFAALGLPVPDFRLISALEDLITFGDEHGWPVVVKACRGGYDGRGVWKVDGPARAASLMAHAAARGIELLVEVSVPIEKELAVLLARRPGGETAVYPVIQTVQRGGICHELLVPAPIAPALAESAQRLGLAVAEAIDVTGTLAVELFLAGEQIVINELAARPHNSGHFSIEGCTTSQFENHLRAILDWPLGSTRLVAPAVATANVLAGPETRELAAALPAALAIEGVHVHLYGKALRPGRKVGHVTALGHDLDDARTRAKQAAALLAGSGAASSQ